MGERILVVGPQPPPFGGMAVQGLLLERKLCEEGFDARHLATNPPLGFLERIPLARSVVGLAVYLVALARAAARSRVVHVLAASNLYFLVRVTPAVLLGRLFRRRVVVNYRGGLAEAFLRRHGWWVRVILRCVHALTVPSAYLARIFRDVGMDVTVVPNVTDLERFPFRERASLQPRLLVNRNLEPMYNVGLAIEAWRRVRDVHADATLTVVGAGSERQALEDRIRSWGVSGCTFAGRVANEDMAEVYGRHDVLLNPTDVDNMPISVLEGLACGLGVVSTDVGGVPDVVSHEETALLVPPRDPAAMAAAVLRLLAEPELAMRLARAGRDLARSFGWEAVRVRLLAVYRGETLAPD